MIIVAALISAATIIVFPAQSHALAVIDIDGLPQWQEGLARQSLSAVADGIPQDVTVHQKAEIMQAVALRLFDGYSIKALSGKSGSFKVSFSSVGDTEWKVDIQTPSLTGEPLKWFESDSANFKTDTETLLAHVPLKSIAWSDRALQDQIEKMTEKTMPGWTPTVLIQLKDGAAQLTVSFVPAMPLILAVNPILVSNSLPTLLHGEIKEGLMGRFVPFIGIPVKWAALHAPDIQVWAEDFINNRRITERSASYADAEFQAAQISKLNVRMESKYYTIGAWAAVYAGTSDKSAEIGVHIGRKVPIIPRKFDIEAYAEGILGLQEWNVNGRFGLRWRSIRDLWLGGEWDTKDDKWWAKLSMDPQLHKPYIWLRVNEDGKVNGALGWKATEYISFEAEYDQRDEDRWCLKMLGNL